MNGRSMEAQKRSGHASGSVGQSRCPVCNSTRTALFLEGEDRLAAESVGSSRTTLSHGRILRCSECGLCFRAFRPTAEQLGDLYREADDSVYEAEAENRMKTAQRHRKFVSRYFQHPGSVIDVGCASGVFLSVMADAGWKAFGVEPSSSQCRRAQELLRDRAVVDCRTLETATLPEGVDLVTIWDVLEHVPDPVEFLRLSQNLLRSGGYLILNTPRIDSVIARLLGGRWPLLLAEHLNYWTAGSLRECAKRAGLELVDTGSRPVSFSTGYVLHRLSQHGIPLTWQARELGRSLGFSLTASIPIWMGEIVAVLRKPNS